MGNIYQIGSARCAKDIVRTRHRAISLQGDVIMDAVTIGQGTTVIVCIDFKKQLHNLCLIFPL